LPQNVTRRSQEANKQGESGALSSFFCRLVVMLCFLQFLSEQMGQAEATKLDDQYNELERVSCLFFVLIFVICDNIFY
jgi:hypothetical protein